MTRTRHLAAALLLAALAACANDREPNRPEPSQRATSSPAPESAGDDRIAANLPRIEHRGGPFLRHPQVVTITFDGDDPALVAHLERFGHTITRSHWWRAVTEGYCTKSKGCISAGRPGRAVRLDDQLPAKLVDVDVGELLAQATDAGRLGPVDADTLLIAYLPATVTLADAFVPRYCGNGPRALHRALRLERLTIPYAVIPRCDGRDQLTASASQEILEATANPDPAARGFAFQQTAENLAFTATGVEPVDPCAQLSDDTTVTIEGSFVVQRAWSNRAAARGTDPCIPTPAGRPYVALVSREPIVRLTQEGERETITLHAAADRPTSAWRVTAVDLTGQHDGQRYVDVSLNRTRVSRGQTAELTITVRKLHPKELVTIGLVSTLDGHSHTWPLAWPCHR